MCLCVDVHLDACGGRQKWALDLLEPKFTDGSELPDRMQDASKEARTLTRELNHLSRPPTEN